MNPEEFKLIKPGKVRVRIAPAPTGFLHIGTARAALFNYLFAKKNHGVFILRIEDTDPERSKPEYEKDIIETLNWLKIEPDEGPGIGGEYGPYRQSERKEIYEKYLKKLLEEDKAYYCFCSEEDLEAKREYQLSIGEAPHYSGKCANLSEEIVKKNLSEKKSFVIRFRVPKKKVKFNDLIRDQIEFDASLMGDISIAKSISKPLYNLAVVIDDYEMKISHVIRGEDHIPNTPKQILIQEALGFSRPKYAHLPLILGPDKSKLSKRHGAVSVSEYKNQGYLSEALVNSMVLLGWNPGTEREIYTINSLVKEFSLEGIQKSGAVFNTKKLDSLSGFYVRKKSIEKLTDLCIPFLIEGALIEPIFKEVQFPPAYGGREIVQRYKISETKKEIGVQTLQGIVSLYQERLKKLSEISELADYFFKDKLEYDRELLEWNEMSDEEIKKSLDVSERILSKIKSEDFNKGNLTNILLSEAEKFGEKIKKMKDRGYLLWPLRIALTGKKASAGPFEIAEILGKEKVLKRVGEAKELMK
ncbi:MAG: glutamate--tRNA ligase [Patescibacteria group bacterium]|nr:glutamate--tRNA ligase [Patescibacteria group bacterium]